MTMSGVFVVVMIVMMIVMCGGMIGGALWAFTRRRRSDTEPHSGPPPVHR